MGKQMEKLQIIPLGGLGEIGKNMTVFRYGDDIIVIDAGLMFPEDDMLGIDLVIPDISYLVENKDKVRAIFITHGHEDHIGALPFVLKELEVPVYGTPLALGILQGRLKEKGVSTADLHPIKPGDQFEIGPFTIGFIRVNHSIADAVAIYLKTPIGTILHTGDFKIDHTPVDGQVTEFHRFAELGNEGVLVMLSDSTNAERPGFTKSERSVGASFDEKFRAAQSRIIIASFSSNVHRLQQAIDAAFKFGRKVAVIGRSMLNVVGIAIELGYLKVPDGILIDISEINNYAPNRIVILTTGSQGEPMSALTRMAMSDHRKVEIVPGDTVMISATPIPGNEKLVARTVDYLFRQGAEVIYEASSGIHVSGHGSQEELKLMLNLVRPTYFIPVHGEYRMLKVHAKIAQELGIPKANVFIAENGSVLEFTAETGAINGKVTAGAILVDGLGVGDIGNIVMRDRRQLSQDGILIAVIAMDKASGCVVSGPEIVSRGFVYVRESEQLMEEARMKIQEALDRCEANGSTDWGTIKNSVRDILGKFLYEKTRRRPMIMPIILEV
ncbi:MAG TPA: ribonuclease J [Negativicutes bacterium]|nr:ribonuclease J [Negativicutes bacterium]